MCIHAPLGVVAAITPKIFMAAMINSGQVWINKHLDLPPDIPFGGAKQSGLGIEQGQEGFEEFTQARIICRRLNFDMRSVEQFAALRIPVFFHAILCPFALPA